MEGKERKERCGGESEKSRGSQQSESSLMKFFGVHVFGAKK